MSDNVQAFPKYGYYFHIIPDFGNPLLSDGAPLIDHPEQFITIFPSLLSPKIQSLDLM